MSSIGSSSPTRANLEVGAASLEIEIRVNPRAERILLRTDAARGTVVLVLPSARHREDGLAFARRKARWLHARLAEMRERIPFANGMELPLLGRPYRVRHAPGSVDPIRVEDGEILVGGNPARLPLQLATWLRAEARRQIAGRAAPMAAQLGYRIGAISVRDTRSRWGSCSSAGALSFSWRLILAPEPVLDYVVAHEVAHLRVPDHSARFWRTVAELRPGYAAERRWLKRHGAELHRYG